MLSCGALGDSLGITNVCTSIQRNRNEKFLNATVVFLDESKHIFIIDARAKGAELIERVFSHVSLKDRTYFGLQYLYRSWSKWPDTMKWLNPKKSIKSQFEDGVFYLRVRYYVVNPNLLRDELTRTYYYLQVRDDISKGKFQLTFEAGCMLASYALQIQFGDYDSRRFCPNVVSKLPLLPDQTFEMECRIRDYHTSHRGLSAKKAIYFYLDYAKRLDFYGIDRLHVVKDSKKHLLQVGVKANGLMIFKNGLKLNYVPWIKIIRIGFRQKEFFIHLRRERSENFDTCLLFFTSSRRAGSHLWKNCADQHKFFRENWTSLNKSFRNPAIPISYNFEFGGVRTPIRKNRFTGLNQILYFLGCHTSVQGDMYSSEYDLYDETLVETPEASETPEEKETQEKKDSPEKKVREPLSKKKGRKREEKASTSAEVRPFSPTLNEGESINYADEESNGRSSSQPSTSKTQLVLDIPRSSEGVGLVECVFLPNKDGKFGFDIIGGSDLNSPVTVCKVVPGSPSDTCSPKLIVGDEIIMINNIRVDKLTNMEIVLLIMSVGLKISRKLTVTVKRKEKEDAMSVTGDADGCTYVPMSPSYDPNKKMTALERSMHLLADSLAGGEHNLKFESPSSQSVEKVATSAGISNPDKNRYINVLPYDATRVILKCGRDGDYINASYIDIPVPSTGSVIRYIASQGPLVNTVPDFWQMVLEEGSSLIVMLTLVMEGLLTKCHLYWPPNVGDYLQFNYLQVTNLGEVQHHSGTYVVRTFELMDIRSGDNREVKQMQYLKWPDQGVPEDDTQFLNFVHLVREERERSTDRPIIHCSAGVGRTGVMLTVEAGLCFMEANQPVYPMEIVRLLREQRPFMIQTTSQYQFVCSAILKAYNEKKREATV